MVDVQLHLSSSPAVITRERKQKEHAKGGETCEATAWSPQCHNSQVHPPKKSHRLCCHQKIDYRYVSNATSSPIHQHKDLSSSLSLVSNRTRHCIRRLSFSDSDPPSLTGVGSSSTRRVSRPIIPVDDTPSCTNETRATQIPLDQAQPPLPLANVNLVHLASGNGEVCPSLQQLLMRSMILGEKVTVQLPSDYSHWQYLSWSQITIPKSIPPSRMKFDALQIMEIQFWMVSGNRKPGEIIPLLFSVVRSSPYCGIAEMTGPYNEDALPDIFLEKDRLGLFSFCSLWSTSNVILRQSSFAGSLSEL